MYLFLMIAGIVILSFLKAPTSLAHGYVQIPASRVKLGNLGMQDVGEARWEPQNLQFLRGFPAGGPADR